MTTTLTDAQINALLQSDEDQLLEQLGMRAAVATRRLERSAELAPDVGADVLAMGIKDDMKALGARILRRWNRSAYELACGKDPADATTRADLQRALGVGEAAAIGVLTGALIGMGMMAALAPVVAALIVKKFFNPAYDEFCEYWQGKL